jgi:hypothetical protein
MYVLVVLLLEASRLSRSGSPWSQLKWGPACQCGRPGSSTGNAVASPVTGSNRAA